MTSSPVELLLSGHTSCSAIAAVINKYPTAPVAIGTVPNAKGQPEQLGSMPELQISWTFSTFMSSSPSRTNSAQ